MSCLMGWDGGRTTPPPRGRGRAGAPKKGRGLTPTGLRSVALAWLAFTVPSLCLHCAYCVWLCVASSPHLGRLAGRRGPRWERLHLPMSALVTLWTRPGCVPAAAGLRAARLVWVPAECGSGFRGCLWGNRVSIRRVSPALWTQTWVWSWLFPLLAAGLDFFTCRMGYNGLSLDGPRGGRSELVTCLALSVGSQGALEARACPLTAGHGACVPGAVSPNRSGTLARFKDRMWVLREVGPRAICPVATGHEEPQPGHVPSRGRRLQRSPSRTEGQPGADRLSPGRS